MVGKRGSSLIAVAVVWVVSGHETARAEEPGSVVVLTMAKCCAELSWPEAEDALIAELTLVDIPVQVLSGSAVDDSSRRDELEKVATEHNAAAAVRLTKSPKGARAGVDLWIVDRITGKTTYRHLDVNRSYDSAATIDVAVRTVEALRASLLELRITGREVEKKSVAPEIVELVETTPIKRERPLMGVGASSSLNISPGGMGARGAFSVVGIVRPARGLDVELSVLFSPLGKDLKTAEAISSFDYVLLRGWIFYRFFEKALFQPSLGLGGGALIAWTKGQTLDHEPLLKDSETVAYLGGGLRVFVFPTALFDLFVGSNVGLTLPEIKAVHGLDTTAGRFGRPFIEVLLGAELRFS